MEYLCEASVAGPHRKVQATGFWGKELSSSVTSANYSHLLFQMFWGPWSKIRPTCMISARWRPTKSQNPSEQYTVQCAWKLITPTISHFQTICLALKVHLLDNLEGLKHFPGQNLNLQGIFGQNSVRLLSRLFEINKIVKSFLWTLRKLLVRLACAADAFRFLFLIMIIVITSYRYHWYH